jgi:C1A family cysteine protease
MCAASTAASFAVAAVAGIAAATPMDAMEFKFINYVAQHAKSYATKEEYELRKSLFAKIDADIEQYNATEKTSVHAHNFLSDLTEYEKSKLTGTKRMPEPEHEDETLEIYGSVPSFATGVDWVTAGAVAPVKNQGSCGSCWAFSAASATESAYHIAMNKGTSSVTQISEQQLVSCVTTCSGCNGGWYTNCWYYYLSHGAYYEADWPYTATNGSCTYNSADATNVRLSSYRNVTAKSISALQSAVAAQPVSVAIAAGNSYFQSYSTGVLTNAYLCGTYMDHGVVAVGYGNENGTDYWLVRNSWGSGWGDKGYVKIAATDDNGG